MANFVMLGDGTDSVYRLFINISATAQLHDLLITCRLSRPAVLEGWKGFLAAGIEEELPDELIIDVTRETSMAEMMLGVR